jgi:hypothetical protein
MHSDREVAAVCHGFKLDAALTVQAKERRDRLFLSAKREMRVHSVSLGWQLMAWAAGTAGADGLRTHLRQNRNGLRNGAPG